MAASPAAAAVVQWADLTASDATTGTVTGTITVGSDVVHVTFSGGYYVAQTDGTGTYYWTEPNASSRPYTGGSVSNAPGDSDIIELNEGGPKTITFDRPVSNVYLALNSWNGNAGTFDQSFQTISDGCGYWGCGSFTDVTPTSFTGTGELHGVIAFNGSFSTVSFTDRSELWHGIQIGIGGVSPPAAPEPSTWALMIAGVGLAGAALRRRREALAVA